MRDTDRLALRLSLLALGLVAAGCDGSAGADRDAGPRTDGSVIPRPDGAMDPPPPPPPPTPVGETITTVVVENPTSAAMTNVPVTFAMPFRAGDVPSGHFVVARTGDVGLATQLDAKVMHADGSLRHGILTLVVPSLEAHEELRVELVASTTAGSTGDPLTMEGLLASGFSSRVDLTADGTTSSAAFASTSDVWLAGPIVSEWTSLADVTVRGRPLQVRFDVRWFGGGRARVAVTVENDWAFEPGPANVTYDARIENGGVSAYERSAIEHYALARWRRVTWWGEPIAAHVRHEPAYLVYTGAVPAYDTTLVIGEAPIASLRAEWDAMDTGPMAVGFPQPYMPETGGRRDIGPLPAWDATYLLAPDARLREVLEGTADLAGSWPIHYRDRETGLPPTITDHPYMTLLGNEGDTINPRTGLSEAFPHCDACETPMSPDTAHQPSFAYLAYLLFGDRAHLDELHFWADYSLIEQNPYYRAFERGLIDSGQTRAQAWSMRTLGYAAWVTPDAHPLAAYFRDAVEENLRNYVDAHVTTRGNALGFLDANYTFDYDDGTGLAAWMDDFFTWSIGQLLAMGFEPARPLFEYKARFVVGRMTEPYCWIAAAPYAFTARDSADSPIYDTFEQAYRANADPAAVDLPCASDAMASALGMRVGEMGGYADSAEGYPSNMQPALAAAAEHGAPGAAAAWATFVARAIQPDYAEEPQFAIVPTRERPTP
jgi:hypothetical protein